MRDDQAGWKRSGEDFANACFERPGINDVRERVRDPHSVLLLVFVARPLAVGGGVVVRVIRSGAGDAFRRVLARETRTRATSVVQTHEKGVTGPGNG